MRALVFDLSIPKYLLARTLGARVKGLHYGPGTCFTLRDDVPEPTLPSRAFARLTPTHTGLCGSDLGAVFFKSSTVLSAFASFPVVFGHEVLARVLTPPDGAVLREGDRVVVDPFLSCAIRGADECPRCAAGHYATCERAGTGPMKGMMLGACSALPGGFSERMAAHRSQLFRVPDGVADEVAVLAEPLSVGVHAVLQNPPRGAERVLVIGGGMIAFATVWALRELFPAAHVTCLALEPHQLELATRLGAHRAVRPSGEDTVETLGRELGSAVLRPTLGRPFLASGFDRVIDCIGSQTSLDDALRVARAGATLVLVGCAGVVPSLDWTFVWSRELTIAGTLAYGWAMDPRPAPAQRRRTFEITLELLTTTARPLRELVTHVLPMDRFGEALEVNLDRRGTKSIKAVLTP
jgi:threonine dehydrogenase-like Zn-dependent dehydrogenase